MKVKKIRKSQIKSSLEEKKCTIYAYQNKLNLKIYIGQTIGFKKRQCNHKYHAFSKKTNSHLYSAIRKYGYENFDLFELEIVDIDFADDAEIFWISFFNSSSRIFGYNLNGGGKANKIVSQETRNKLSITRKAGFASGKFIHYQTGKPISDEVKKKISDKNTGKKSTQESKDKARQTRLINKINGKVYKKSKQYYKFTWDIINNIRFDYQNGLKGKILADKYNMSESYMYKIIKNVIWIK